MEDLIPLLIFALLSAAGSWLQNRREKKGETSWEEVEGEGIETLRPPSTSESQARPDPKRIEETIREALGIPSAEELKRGTDRAEPPAIPPSRSRPTPRHPERVGPQGPMTRSRPASRETASREKSAAQELKNARNASIESQEAELEAARARRAAALKERDLAIEKARAAKPATPQLASASSYRRVSPKSIQTILRDPESAKTAFAASVVFGPPKGLE